MQTIDSISKKVNEGELDIPKEIFVLGFSTSWKTFMPGLLWPICSHSNNEEQQTLIQTVIEVCADADGFDQNKWLNFSTNGDSCRRQMFASMMQKDASSFPFGIHLKNFKLFDLEVGITGQMSSIWLSAYEIH